MSTNNAKYLVLRGKNKDIYFIQKRLTKAQSLIIGKDFIKKSLETTSLEEAIAKRDEILAELDQIELNINNQDNINTSNHMLKKDIEFTTNMNENSNKDEKSENMENNMAFSGINMGTNEDMSNNSISKGKKSRIFSLEMLKFPEKQDLVARIDKLIPIAILFITLFIALVA